MREAAMVIAIIPQKGGVGGAKDLRIVFWLPPGCNHDYPQLWMGSSVV